MDLFRLKFGEMEDSNHNDKPSRNRAIKDELPRNSNQASEEIGIPHTEESQ